MNSRHFLFPTACLLVIAASGSAGAASAQSLIPNGSFEAGSVSSCDQGFLPAPWFQAGLQFQGADVYTCGTCDPTDPTGLNGLSPGSFGNFPNACPPPSGERFIAGWSMPSPPECPGVQLLAPLQDGTIYRASGMFMRSATHGGTGPYEFYLSSDALFDATDTLLTAIGADAPLDEWVLDSADLVAPSGSSLLPYLILVPTGSDSYVGMEDISLVAVLPETYCSAGTSASGCQALISAGGTPSATASSGFMLQATGVEGAKDGLFFFGTNGQQASPWGNGTSFQCVVPPVKRAGLLDGSGTVGFCDGSFIQDLNALWCPTCPKPTHNPGVGAIVQAQLWYRDPQNTSNQTTSLSNAIEFAVGP